MTAKFLFVFLFCSAAAASDSIRVGFSEEYAQVFAPGDSSITERLSPLFGCPLSELGAAFEIIELPHARVLYELKNGQVDVGFPFTQADDRDKYATLTLPVASSRYWYVSRNGKSFPPKDNSSVAYIRGFSGESLLLGLGVEKRQVSSWEQAIEMLLLQRVDSVMITERALGRLNFPKFAGLHVEAADIIQVGFYVANDRPLILEKLNDGVANCHD